MNNDIDKNKQPDKKLRSSDNPGTQTAQIRQASWTDDLEDIRHIRTSVFILEQDVNSEIEWDGLDNDAVHLLAMLNGKAVGYVRFLKHGKITRMAVLKPHRGQQIGFALLNAVEKEAQEQGISILKADAQVSALPFYEKYGYEICSNIFMDAGIKHRSIAKQLPPLKLEILREKLAVSRFESTSYAKIAIVEAIDSGLRTVDILTDRLRNDIFDDRLIEQALSSLARRTPHSKIRILIKDAKSLHHKNHCIINIARRLPSKIEIKKLTISEISDQQMAYVCVDRSHLVFFNDEHASIGFINAEAKPESEKLLTEFETLWAKYGEIDINFRSLGL